VKGYGLPSSHKVAHFKSQTLPNIKIFVILPKREKLTHKLASYAKEFAKLIVNEKTLDKFKRSQINHESINTLPIKIYERI
jgi:hypothetical protein